MMRRSSGFVSKKPHKKSRGGCGTCKRKKVKCDEILPQCTYCTQRGMECIYETKPGKSDISLPRSTPESALSSSTSNSRIDENEDFNSLQLQTMPWLLPAADTPSGLLTNVDLGFLYYYKANTWPTLTTRLGEPLIEHLLKEWIPQTSLSHSYLLFTILSLSAAHSNRVNPSAKTQNLVTMYRHKSFESFNKALRNITNDNYETLLITAMFMQVMVPPPEAPCPDKDLLKWMYTFLTMTQGIRVLAGLKWASGIENLTTSPIFRREIRSLPPPPKVDILPNPQLYPDSIDIGNSPLHPNPPATYFPTVYTRSNPLSRSPTPTIDLSNLPFRPQVLATAINRSPKQASENVPSWQIPAPAFLPPSLMALLYDITKPNDMGPIDLHRATILPVLHAFSPIFLSLYHFHISSDAYVRIIVLPTFLTPEFVALIPAQEPRALVILGWWFASLRIIPSMWWVQETIPKLLQAISNVVIRSNSKLLMNALEGAFRIVRLAETRGPEVAVRSVFQDWEGVNWEKDESEGPSIIPEVTDLGC